jgi:hypothetical protein
MEFLLCDGRSGRCLSGLIPEIESRTRAPGWHFGPFEGGHVVLVPEASEIPAFLCHTLSVARVDVAPSDPANNKF